MEEPVRAYARLRLEMAREELDTARSNIAHGRFRAALSRAYYVEGDAMPNTEVRCPNCDSLAARLRAISP